MRYTCLQDRKLKYQQKPETNGLPECFGGTVRHHGCNACQYLRDCDDAAGTEGDWWGESK